MPDLTDIIRDALLQSGLAQFPDEKIYRAATQVKPEDRPPVPVTVGDAENTTLFRVRPKVTAISNFDRPGNPIIINRNSPEYQDPDPLLLAAVIAHEAQHHKTGIAEGPAYAKQAEFLRSTVLNGTPYAKAVEAVAERYAREERKAKK